MPSGSPPAGVTTMSHKDGDGRSRDVDATWTRVRFPAAPLGGVSEKARRLAASRAPRVLRLMKRFAGTAGHQMCGVCPASPRPLNLCFSAKQPPR